MQNQRDKTKEIVDNIIESEQGYLFTSDLSYINHKTNLIPTQYDKDGKVMTLQDPKKVFIDELRSRVDTYYNIIIRNIRDSVPKAIGYFLVKAA